ncbi:hypothetical protein [Amycolatopsis thermoflava]|uniref:hypothetical protein n=1 Tax=Amycolatopsis thermoflava TaxID=84480 RepID=UPI003EB913D2
MSEYLRKAADMLAKAEAANAANRVRNDADKNETRLRIARDYALLAAIDKGLLPEQTAENLYGRLGGDAW